MRRPDSSELLDEQSVAIGLGDDLLHDLCRQCAAAGQPRDQALNVFAVEATERQAANAGKPNPGRLEFGPEREECKHR